MSAKERVFSVWNSQNRRVIGVQYGSYMHCDNRSRRYRVIRIDLNWMNKATVRYPSDIFGRYTVSYSSIFDPVCAEYAWIRIFCIV